jgi:hypothetical protein
MNLFGRIFGGRKQPELQHPVLGKLLLISTRTGSYWEGEPLVGARSIGLAIETAGGEPPSEAQLRFVQKTIGDLDAAFGLASPLLIPRYEEWIGKTFPTSWRDAFTFAGMSVPLDGVSSNDWELSYESCASEAKHLFTCYFEKGKPAHVSIDG